MSSASDQLRLFIAAALPAELISYFSGQAAQFDPKFWRIVPEENLHLTLLFLGNTPSQHLPEIKSKLAEIAAAEKAFTLNLAAMEAGPVLRSPRLIWARFEQNARFESLAKQLQITLAPETGLPKKLIPHVTLARKKKDAGIISLQPQIVPVQNFRLQVSEIGIWQSVLGSPHPAYHVLDRFALVKSPDQNLS